MKEVQKMDINLQFKIDEIEYFCDFNIEKETKIETKLEYDETETDVEVEVFKRIYNRTFLVDAFDSEGENVYISETKKRELIEYITKNKVDEINDLI